MCWYPCNGKNIYFGQNGVSFKDKYPGTWNDVATSPWQQSPGSVAIDLDAVNRRFYFGASTLIKDCDLSGGDVQSSNMGFSMAPLANVYAIRAYPALSKLNYVRSIPGSAAARQRAIIQADLDDSGGSRSTVYSDGIDAGHPDGADVFYWGVLDAVCQNTDTEQIFFCRASDSTAAGGGFYELCRIDSDGTGLTVLTSTDADTDFRGITGSLEIDYINDKLWFIRSQKSGSHEQQICRCDFDGTNQEIMHTAPTNAVFYDIQINHGSERIFYTYDSNTSVGPYTWDDSTDGLRSALLDFTDDRFDQPASKIYLDAGQWSNAQRFRLGEGLIAFDNLA